MRWHGVAPVIEAGSDFAPTGVVGIPVFAVVFRDALVLLPSAVDGDVIPARHDLDIGRDGRGFTASGGENTQSRGHCNSNFHHQKHPILQLGNTL